MDILKLTTVNYGGIFHLKKKTFVSVSNFNTMLFPLKFYIFLQYLSMIYQSFQLVKNKIPGCTGCRLFCNQPKHSEWLIKDAINRFFWTILFDINNYSHWYNQVGGMIWVSGHSLLTVFMEIQFSFKAHIQKLLFLNIWQLNKLLKWFF